MPSKTRTQQILEDLINNLPLIQMFNFIQSSPIIARIYQLMPNLRLKSRLQFLHLAHKLQMNIVRSRKSSLSLHSTSSLRSLQNYFHTRLCFKMGYLQKLYQYSKTNKTPFFKLQSHNIRIIQDPLDFYLSLKGRKAFNHPLIGLASHVYTWERALYNVTFQAFKDIDVTMVFDYNRSLREQKGESSAHMLSQWRQSLGQKDNVTVAFNRNSIHSGVVGEISGVHHQKIAIFDDKIIVGGANMSQSYFLNRKDRYMEFNQCQQMGSYLYEYLKVLAENSYQLQAQSNKLKKPKDNLKQHFKLWQMSYRPKQFKQSVSEQQAYVDNIQKQMQIQQSRNVSSDQIKKRQVALTSRNQEIAKQIGTSIKVRQQVDERQYNQRMQTARQNLFGVGRQEFVGNELELIQNTHFRGNDLTERGQKVYIFPFMHYPRLNITSQPSLFHSILQWANLNSHDILISSGYLNMSEKTLKVLSQTQKAQQRIKHNNNKVQIICSSPQANSFFEGGKFKKYIPYFYRCFEIDLLKRFNKSNKISIFEYNKNDEWTFHSKGVWLKQSENSYLSIVGSSNYNGRSQKSDIQLQFYLYSTCQKFNKRLDKQYQHMKEHCKKVELKELEQDKQINTGLWVKIMGKIFKRFL